MAGATLVECPMRFDGEDDPIPLQIGLGHGFDDLSASVETDATDQFPTFDDPQALIDDLNTVFVRARGPWRGDDGSGFEEAR